MFGPMLFFVPIVMNWIIIILISFSIKIATFSMKKKMKQKKRRKKNEKSYRGTKDAFGLNRTHCHNDCMEKIWLIIFETKSNICANIYSWARQFLSSSFDPNQYHTSSTVTIQQANSCFNIYAYHVTISNFQVGLLRSYEISKSFVY